ncbi:Uu.00g067080.m01.CDS01 [Anthostomella pinea]|uniref:Uu.00g067080.m01.CDS01 n=1 Tax=Anthostomella pinea TaxID=933095 RepID=A0AAI8VV99_9PEZI|nr:Uu.00g067080.m01.CDS01 [Anthostomella pinea]
MDDAKHSKTPSLPATTPTPESADKPTARYGTTVGSDGMRNMMDLCHTWVRRSKEHNGLRDPIYAELLMSIPYQDTTEKGQALESPFVDKLVNLFQAAKDELLARENVSDEKKKLADVELPSVKDVQGVLAHWKRMVTLPRSARGGYHKPVLNGQHTDFLDTMNSNSLPMLPTDPAASRKLSAGFDYSQSPKPVLRLRDPFHPVGITAHSIDNPSREETATIRQGQGGFLSHTQAIQAGEASADVDKTGQDTQPTMSKPDGSLRPGVVITISSSNSQQGGPSQEALTVVVDQNLMAKAGVCINIYNSGSVTPGLEATAATTGTTPKAPAVDPVEAAKIDDTGSKGTGSAQEQPSTDERITRLEARLARLVEVVGKSCGIGWVQGLENEGQS